MCVCLCVCVSVCVSVSVCTRARPRKCASMFDQNQKYKDLQASTVNKRFDTALCV